MLTNHRNRNRFFQNAPCWILLLLLGHALHGQVSDTQRQPREDARRNSVADTSDLAKDNLNRVAASAVQIRTVLVTDAGLLVELKRCIAKEATDTGQAVEDSKLLDAAI